MAAENPTPRPNSQPERKGFFDISELEIHPNALDQVVGWGSGPNYKGPLALRDFIASRAPATAQNFGISTGGDYVRSISELNEDEINNVVCERMARAPQDMKWAFLSGGVFSNSDLIREVRSRSSIGMHMVGADSLHIGLIENLALNGKLYPTRPEEPRDPVSQDPERPLTERVKVKMTPKRPGRTNQGVRLSDMLDTPKLSDMFDPPKL